MRRFLPWIGPLFGLALLLFFYRSVLFSDGQYGYRDSAHFYYPLYHKVEAEWQAGRVPLWDPSENAGMPLLGNPTAAVLYPGKLIFTVLSYPQAVRWYAILHSGLAFVGMLVLMRSWGASRAASSISALSYAFGAPVLFQYCNIIFLVGAAWTPWGFVAVDRWLRLGRLWALPALALVLAMQVLGGDPESAYVVGLCAGGYAAGLAWDRRRRPVSPRPRSRAWVWLVPLALVAWVGLTILLAAKLPGLRAEDHESPWHPFIRWFQSGKLPRFRPAGFEGPVPGFPWVAKLPMVVAGLWGVVGVVLLVRWRRLGSSRVPLVPMLVGLVASAVLAGAISAAQLGPVYEFTRISGRATDQGAHDIYPFSFEPYRLVEAVWPGFYGRDFGKPVWWFASILPKITHRAWIPSIYLGGLTLLLALGTIGFRGGTPWRAWLTGIALVSLVASFGEFASPLWYARFIDGLVPFIGPHDKLNTNSVRLDGWLRDGDGSPYSLMASLLPGFHTFRFPSKLLSFTALAVAGLAGLGWDRVALEQKTRKLAWLATVGTDVSMILMILGVKFRGSLIAWFTSWKASTIFGPLDAKGAVDDLLLSFAQGMVVMAAALGLIRLASRKPKLAGFFAVLVVAADLALANASMVQAVPQAEFAKTAEVWKRIEEAEKLDPSPGPFRVHRMPIWSPLGRQKTRSEDRILDMVSWERDTLQPKYGLLNDVEYTYTMGTAELYDYEWFFSPFPRAIQANVAPSLGLKAGESIVVYPRRGFDLWNSRYFVLPKMTKWDDPDRGVAAFLPGSIPIYPTLKTFEGPDGIERARKFGMEWDYQILKNPNAFPRAWIVHELRFKEPVQGLNRAERKETMEEILFSNEDPFWQDERRTYHDARRIAWVEVEDRSTLTPYNSTLPPLPGDKVKVVEHTSQKVVLDVTLARPGLVVLADVYYPGWKLTIDREPAPIHRANRLMRGAAVQAGDHRLIYTYDPDSFRYGKIVSLIGLLLLGIVLPWALWRGRHRV